MIWIKRDRKKEGRPPFFFAFSCSTKQCRCSTCSSISFSFNQFSTSTSSGVRSGSLFCFTSITRYVLTSIFVSGTGNSGCWWSVLCQCEKRGIERIRQPATSSSSRLRRVFFRSIPTWFSAVVLRPCLLDRPAIARYRFAGARIQSRLPVVLRPCLLDRPRRDFRRCSYSVPIEVILGFVFFVFGFHTTFFDSIVN